MNQVRAVFFLSQSPISNGKIGTAIISVSSDLLEQILPTFEQ